MILGPNIYYKCPACGAYIYTSSILSCNTLGRRYYSDGQKFDSMISGEPDLIKCGGCGTIVKFNQLEKIEYKNSTEKTITSLNARTIAGNHIVVETYKFDNLSIDDLYKALSIFADEKVSIRLKIWRSYNDGIRHLLDMYHHADDILKSSNCKYIDTERYKDNCYALLTLLDANNRDERMLMAELNRNLGNFEECLKLIPKSKIEVPISLKEIFTCPIHAQEFIVPLEQILARECRKGNRYTVLINNYYKELVFEAEQKEQARINEEMRDPRWKICSNGHCFENIHSQCIWCGESKVVDRLDKDVEVQHKLLYIGKQDGHYILTSDADIPFKEERVRKIIVDYYQNKYLYFHLDGKNPNPFHHNCIELDGGIISGSLLRALCENIVNGEYSSIALTPFIK